MTLNHLNLTVADVPETVRFLQSYFGMRDGGGNRNIAMVLDDGGMVLTLTSPKLSHETEVRYPGSFHIGFIQENEEGVNALNRRLKEDGYDVPSPSRQHGSWTFYFRAPGGFVIEVLH